MKGIETNLSSPLFEAVNDLGRNIAFSEPFLRLRKANLALESDSQASSLLSGFLLLQKKVRAQQFTDSYSQEDVTRLRSLQTLVDKNEVIREQLAAHEAAINLLRELNFQMTGLLKVDFAALTRPVIED